MLLVPLPPAAVDRGNHTRAEGFANASLAQPHAHLDLVWTAEIPMFQNQQAQPRRNLMNISDPRSVSLLQE